MDRFAPKLLSITLHDIDVAHAGAYSLYTDAIMRTDRICAELWKAIQIKPEYAGKTDMLILPDFGRDSDFEPGGKRLPTSSHRRCTFADYLDACLGPRHQAKHFRRSKGRINRSRANPCKHRGL
jgi:hypothetical protein